MPVKGDGGRVGGAGVRSVLLPLPVDRARAGVAANYIQYITGSTAPNGGSRLNPADSCRSLRGARGHVQAAEYCSSGGNVVYSMPFHSGVEGSDTETHKGGT